MTEGQKLAEELGQALVNNDSTAAGLAAVNIVGEGLDKLERIAAALEKLASPVNVWGGGHSEYRVEIVSK